MEEMTLIYEQTTIIINLSTRTLMTNNVVLRGQSLVRQMYCNTFGHSTSNDNQQHSDKDKVSQFFEDCEEVLLATEIEEFFIALKCFDIVILAYSLLTVMTIWHKEV